METGSSLYLNWSDAFKLFIQDWEKARNFIKIDSLVQTLRYCFWVQYITSYDQFGSPYDCYVWYILDFQIPYICVYIANIKYWADCENEKLRIVNLTPYIYQKICIRFQYIGVVYFHYYYYYFKDCLFSGAQLRYRSTTE